MWTTSVEFVKMVCNLPPPPPHSSSQCRSSEKLQLGEAAPKQLQQDVEYTHQHNGPSDLSKLFTTAGRTPWQQQQPQPPTQTRRHQNAMSADPVSRMTWTPSRDMEVTCADQVWRHPRFYSEATEAQQASRGFPSSSQVDCTIGNTIRLHRFRFIRGIPQL
jgi:hypothetical protein